MHPELPPSSSNLPVQHPVLLAVVQQRWMEHAFAVYLVNHIRLRYPVPLLNLHLCFMGYPSNGGIGAECFIRSVDLMWAPSVLGSGG